MTNLQMQLAKPFNVDLSLGVWLRHPMERVDIVEGQVYSRLFVKPYGPVLLQLQFQGTVDDPWVDIILKGAAKDADISWAIQLTRWMLNFDAPLLEFYDFLQKNDPIFFEAIKDLRGLRPPANPSIFETLVFAIVGQQVNLNFAYQCKAALEDSFSKKATIDGREWIAGLTPEDFINVTVDELREMKISRAKGRSILELAEAFRKVPMDKDVLKNLPDEQIVEALTSLRGIGPWTANYTLLRGLASQNALPAGDAGLQNAIRKLHRLEQKPSTEDVGKIAEKWSPYRGLATFYLWTWSSLQNEKAK